MHVFIVTQWNGMDYDDSSISNVGVFENLKSALEYCQNTQAYRQYPSDSKIDRKEAYIIQRWIDSNNIECYDGDGKLM